MPALFPVASPSLGCCSLYSFRPKPWLLFSLPSRIIGPALTGGDEGDSSSLSVTASGWLRFKFGGLKSDALFGAFDAGEAGRFAAE